MHRVSLVVAHLRKLPAEFLPDVEAPVDLGTNDAQVRMRFQTLDEQVRPLIGQPGAPKSVSTVGWEPFQTPGEDELRPDVHPWLRQRSTWRQSKESFKPILTSVSLAYCYGFHKLRCNNCPVVVEDLALLLIHLHSGVGIHL